jgi:hypothetical protein
LNTCTNAPDYASGEDIKQVLKSEYRYFGTIDDVMEYIAERKEFERKIDEEVLSVSPLTRDHLR